jgi:hypothetical protein
MLVTKYFMSYTISNILYLSQSIFWNLQVVDYKHLQNRTVKSGFYKPTVDLTQQLLWHSCSWSPYNHQNLLVDIYTIFYRSAYVHEKYQKICFMKF